MIRPLEEFFRRPDWSELQPPFSQEDLREVGGPILPTVEIEKA